MIEKVSTAGWDRERWQAWRRKVQTIGSLAAAALAALLVNTGAVPLPYGLSVMLISAIGGTLTIFRK